MTTMPESMRWPEGERAIAMELAKRLGHTALIPVRELSGVSGARTYLCLPEGSHGRPNAIVVKIGAESLLELDLAGLRLAAAYFRDADLALEASTTAGGLTAIPLRLVSSDAITFEDLYRGDSSPDRVISLIDELFDDVLRLPDLTVQLTSTNAFALYSIIDEPRLARELHDVGDGVPGLIDWWSRARATVQSGSYSRLCHGDLHGRNVLVSIEPERVYAVDFGQTREDHALRDLAKLEREIHLTLLGASHAGRWTSGVLGSVAPEIGHNADPELVKASAAVARIRDHAKNHLPSDAVVQFEYGVALLAQFMFAAGNRALPMATRRAALRAAHAVRADLEAEFPTLKLPEADAGRIYRREALWRFVYTFTRLDQQPGGSWARTIHGWMNAVWAGDEDQIYRNPNMRRQGGTDLTCYTMDGLVTFLRQHLATKDAAEVFTDNEVLSRAFHGLKGKIGFQGGSGTAIPGTAHADVKIRHTVMTVLAVLRYRQGHDGAVGAVEVLRSSLTYLADYLQYWAKDGAHTFGMAMACVKLRELLDTDIVSHLDEAPVDRVRTELTRVIPEMLEALENPSGRVLPTAAEVRRSAPPTVLPALLRFLADGTLQLSDVRGYGVP
jgi:Phosphotransferase enzyme family